jgi:hypothetical protein
MATTQGEHTVTSTDNAAAQGDTRDVILTYVHNPDTDGPDLDQVEKPVTLPRREARQLVNSGAARYADVATDAAGRNLADLSSRAVWAAARDEGLPEVPGESKSATIARIEAKRAEAAAVEQHEDLTAMTMDALREKYPAAAEQPSNAKKADLLAAVEKAQRDEAEAKAQPDVTNSASVPQTTVLPGAQASPSAATEAGAEPGVDTVDLAAEDQS